jgi:predicted RNase H-like HicB family nuclease
MRKRRVLNFPVILEPDETGGFVVTCPLLPGCFSQGETVEEALTNIREAIQLCLEEMAMRGETIPDPSKVLIGSVSVTQ